MKFPTTYLAGKIVVGIIACFALVGVAHGQGAFERNLRLGDQGEDVRRLQVFLNTHGAPVAKTGVGSLGQETSVFGQKTKQAVATFQEFQRTKILSPAKLARGTGNFFTSTREVVNELLKQAPAETKKVVTTTPELVQDVAPSSSLSVPQYAIGGTITGLKEPVLVREASGETIRVNPGEAANFQFTRGFTSGDRYHVTAVSVVPGSQLCYGSENASGVIADASVLTIQFQCTSNLLGDPFQIQGGRGTESFTLGGTVSGLSGTLVLQTEAGDRLVVTSDGAFTFGSRVPNGRTYLVSVQTNPSGPDQTCTVTNGSGTMNGGNVTNISVTCVDNTTTLSLSVDRLALSIAGLVDAPFSGQARLIIITNTGAQTAQGLNVHAPIWPVGTVSNTTCTTTLAPASSCTITVTPGGTASSDGVGSPCSGGAAPIPEVVQVTADNASTVSSEVVILGHGCIYQGGYVFSLDDTTPVTQSVGGTVAALENQSDGMVWGSNGSNASTVSYDVIPGIGETSVTTSSAPTFSDLATYFGGTYAGILGLSSGSFSACDGKNDGQCNTSNIVAFYSQYRTNYGVGFGTYTPTVAPTPKSYYAAGVCDEYAGAGYEDWYLPAICEVTFDYPEVRSEVAGCGVEEHPLRQTIMKNLFLHGLGNFTPAQGVWSSSQFMYYNPETYAWNALAWFTPFPGGGDKNDLAQVRCVRSLTP